MDMPAGNVLKSFFQKDFSCVAEQISQALIHEPDKNRLFEIILCEHFKEVKKCEDPDLKMTAASNILMALDHLGNMIQA